MLLQYLFPDFINFIIIFRKGWLVIMTFAKKTNSAKVTRFKTITATTDTNATDTTNTTATRA